MQNILDADIVDLIARWPDDVIAATSFVGSLRVGEGWLYRVSNEATQPITIASATASLLIGFLGGDRFTKQDKESWASILCSAQGDDGLIDDTIDYAEPIQPQPHWALRAHRTRHVGWAVRCLTGLALPKTIRMVEPYLERAALFEHLDQLWCTCGPSGAWGWGNWVMDLGVMLDFYAHQHEGPESYAGKSAVCWLLDWLNERIDPATGFWWTDHTDDRSAMAGAMHLYPLYWAANREPPYYDRAVDCTLALQQSDGLFAYKTGCGGSQCLDYDAMLILINGWYRLENRRPAIEACALRVLRAIQICRNTDGSWADSRIDEVRSWATQAAAYHASRGSIWDVYARLMTIAMCIEVLTGAPPPNVKSGRHLFELFRPVRSAR